MNEVGEAPTDETLVRACLAGDRQAFDQLVKRHQRQVYLLCYRFLGNHEDASELAQDVFVRAYRGLASFKGTAAFTTWLYRIGVNQCLNRLSKGKPRLEPLDEAALGDAAQAAGTNAVAPDAALIRDERAQRVRRAIAQLPEKQRATVILRAYHELPHEQIAQVLGSSVAAAKTNLHHALKRLRMLLDDK
jgi:RNA polymerase sigma-70 factor (ECF subfamily)